MKPLVQRLTACLCLLIALVQAVSVQHGMILCLEPGGDVNLEATLDGARCEECPGTGTLGSPSGPQWAGSPLCCPCVDIALDLWPDASRTLRASAERELQLLAAMPVPAFVGWPVAPAAPTTRSRAPADGTPTAPALVGSVVLRV